MTKIKAVSKKEQLSVENNYVLALNELTHKTITQNYGTAKITAKDKKDLKFLYENFKQQTVTLNTLYARIVYQKIQALFKKTDLVAVSLHTGENEEGVNVMYHDYFVISADESGKSIVDNEIENEVADKFFMNMPEDLETAILELEVKSLKDMIVVTKDITFEQFLEDYDLTYPIGITVDLDYSEFEPKEKEV